MAKNVIAGRYELIEKIGDGGMAVVYKAKCRVLNRLVAIKILKPDFIEDEKFINNFRKESLAAASLSHPNIVNIYDVGRESNIYYIVMELVEGETLSEKIQEEGYLDLDEALDITKQIAKGLAAAHKSKIVHRDVKPHNILINAEGIPKIADFGIAKATTDTTIVDKTSETIMGSVHYFSPEQARGNYMDARTDIYSLGIVLYEMLTGEVPFDGENPVSVALMQINEEMPYPSDINPDIPIEVEDIIFKATEKQAAERYQTASEMIEDIEKFENGDLPASQAAGAGYSQKAKMGETRLIESEEIKNKDQEAQLPTKRGPGEKKKKSKKILLIFLAIALLFGVGLGAAYFTGMFGEKKVEVPELTGMTFDEAQAEAQKVGLSVHVADKKYSEDEESDVVLEQDPEPGTEVEKGSSIDVVVSMGTAKRTVPNVVGEKKKSAQKILEEAGFKVDFRDKESTEEKGLVVEQAPGGGNEASIGDTVILYLSDGKGKKMVTVPNILGMSLKDAEETLKEKNLEIQHIGEGVSQEYNQGEIMSQSHGAGEEVEEGTTIKVRTSKGASSTKNYYIDYEPAKKERFRMTVKVSDSDGQRTIINDQERKKSDGGENISIKGRGEGKITILFDGKVVGEQKLNFSKEDAN